MIDKDLSLDEAELRVYHAGDLDFAMGLRCQYASFLEYQTRVGGEPSTEIAGRAIWAARVSRRVRAALRELSRFDRRVLRAGYTPLPPAFPHGLEHLELRLVQVLVAERELASAIAAATDPDELARLHATDPADVLRELVATGRDPSDKTARGHARVRLKRYLSDARIALSAAQVAYADVRRAHTYAASRRHHRSFRASLGLG